MRFLAWTARILYANCQRSVGELLGGLLRHVTVELEECIYEDRLTATGM